MHDRSHFGSRQRCHPLHPRATSRRLARRAAHGAALRQGRSEARSRLGRAPPSTSASTAGRRGGHRIARATARAIADPQSASRTPGPAPTRLAGDGRAPASGARARSSGSIPGRRHRSPGELLALPAERWHPGRVRSSGSVPGLRLRFPGRGTTWSLGASPCPCSAAGQHRRRRRLRRRQQAGGARGNRGVGAPLGEPAREGAPARDVALAPREGVGLPRWQQDQTLAEAGARKERGMEMPLHKRAPG
jgi:hypothetical protein